MTEGIIKAKIYIPEDDVDFSLVEQYYTIKNRDDKYCSKCNYKDKDEDICSRCPANLGNICLYDRVNVRGKTYITIPSGNIKRASKYLGIDFTQYKDLRCAKKFDYNLEFTGKLRQGEVVNDVPSANQQLIADTWLQEDKRYGFIAAPPRTGKSVIGVNICCRLGLKTLFIAHQKELLENFMKSFKRDTNLEDLQYETKKELVKIIKKKKNLEDESLQVAMITYQSFIRDASDEEIKKYIAGRFGLVIIDEAHQAGATAYAKFLSKLDAKYKLGMSATPLRKDVLNYVLLNTIGPTTVKSEATGLVPKIELLETNCHYENDSVYAYFLKNMEACEQRNELIVNECMNDLKEHKCIIIPVDSVAFSNKLVEMINDKYGGTIAISYNARILHRDTILDEIDSGKYRVVVAIKSMIKQGIDLKTPSMIYIQSPMSAAPQPKGSPMFYQMGNRVCTPYVGKRQPIIKMFIDPVEPSYYCFLSVYQREIKPNLVGKDGNRPRYIMSEKALKKAQNILVRVRSKQFSFKYTQNKVCNPDHDFS